MYSMYPNNYFHPNWFSGCNSGCCNHTYPAIQPPHSCIPPPPSPFYYHHGPYPPYPAVYPPYYAGAYPPPYHAPPNFSVEQPRYEFDKSVQGRHCCGCRNDGVEMKKEEKKVDVAKETDSLVAPSKSKDESLFPLLWGFPPQQKDGAQGGKGCDSLQKNRDEEGNRNQGKEREFPFPMFWLPEYQRGKDAEISEEQPAKFKVIPVNPLPREDDRREISEVVNNKDKNRNEKGGKEAIETGGKSKEIHVKNNEKKLASKSPQKGSKLPPVCLRVDPLPKRKSCKETPRALSVIKQVESKADTSPAEERKADHNKKEVVAPPPSPQPPSPLDDAIGNNTPVAEERAKKKELSRTEAALVIQSFYRGFDVRKWQPLKKLKQIAKVNEQVDVVRQRILDLEASLDSPKDEKQKVVIAETIMSLLLQLDTIQGLHPSVREIRKGVAKELVSLQERLDLIVSSRNGVEGKIDNKQNESEQQVRKDEEFTETGSDMNSPPDEEAIHAEQYPSEEVKDLMESPIRHATELEKAECGCEGQEQLLVEMPESIESDKDSLLEPAKLVVEAGHPEPLQLEAVHLPMESSIENDSGMEHIAETEKLECQLQEKEQFSAEAAVYSAETREVESKNHSLFESENESGVYAVDNHGNVSQTAENRLGELESINYVPVEDKPSVEVLESEEDKSSVEGFERAQDLTEAPACELEESSKATVMVDKEVNSVEDKPSVKVLQSVEDKSSVEGFECAHDLTEAPACELEESSKATVMVDMEVNSEMQGATEDEPASQVGGSELPVLVTDDMPLLQTDEAVGSVFVQDRQGVEEQIDVAERITLPGYGLEVEPAAEGIACALDDFEESVLKETGDDHEPVYSKEHQSACPVAMEGAENIYENDVHCCAETDTSSKVNDVIEFGNSDIKDPPTGNPQETEDVKCDEGGVPMKLMEENVQLKDLLGMLIKEGKEQMKLISDLNGRIKTLEKNLAKKKKKKLRMPKHRSTRHLVV